MAKTKEMDIKWPTAGENQRVKYAEDQGPYSTPYAVNCRTYGPLERRGRGGSRPGLSKYISTDLGTTITAMCKVSYVDGSGDHQTDLVVIVDGLIKVVSGASVTTTTSFFLLNSGDFILLNDGTSKIYSTITVASTSPVGDVNAYNLVEANGKVYIASDYIYYYDPNAGSIGTLTNAPEDQLLIAVYRNRLVTSAGDHIFSVSRTGDFDDFDFSDRYTDLSRAIRGTTGDSGVIGNDLTCIKAWEDKVLLLGTKDDLWVIEGNVTHDGRGGGRKKNISHEVGPIQQGAMAINDDGLCLFLSRQGVYTWQVGSPASPKPFSEEVVPEELRDIDTSTIIVNIEYDKKENGFYIFLTPEGATTGEHWFLEMKSRSFGRDKYQQNHQPHALAKMPISGDSNVIMGCKDGYLRRHDRSATNDDGSNLESDILIGALRLGSKRTEGKLQQMFAEIAASSAAVTWAIVVANSAETAVDNAITDIEAGTTTNVRATGAWAAGFNNHEYPKARGHWVVLWLSANSVWAYESVLALLEKVGKRRS